MTRHEMGDGFAKDCIVLQSPFFNVLQELDVSRLVLNFTGWTWWSAAGDCFTEEDIFQMPKLCLLNTH
jgi:hypothetical protein